MVCPQARPSSSDGGVGGGISQPVCAIAFCISNSANADVHQDMLDDKANRSIRPMFMAIVSSLVLMAVDFRFADVRQSGTEET